MAIHSVEKALVLCQNLFPHCVSLHHCVSRRLKTSTLSTRSLRDKICPLMDATGCFTLLFHSTEIRISRPNWDSYSRFLLWIGARLLVVAMLLTLLLTEKPQGKTRI